MEVPGELRAPAAAKDPRRVHHWRRGVVATAVVAAAVVAIVSVAPRLGLDRQPLAADAPEPRQPTGEAVLRGDGLGVVSFGDPADVVVERLTALYGPPTPDELSNKQALHHGTPTLSGCALFSEQRVEWSISNDLDALNKPNLIVGFDRTDSGEEVLTAYSHYFDRLNLDTADPTLPGILLSTEAGARLWMPVADVMSLYPAAPTADLVLDHPSGSVLELKRIDSSSGPIYLRPGRSGIGNWEITDRVWGITAGAACSR